MLNPVPKAGPFCSALFACALSAAMGPPPTAAEEREAECEVLSAAAAVRTGPGDDQRLIVRPERGQRLPIVARTARGGWFLVSLPDGTEGFISAAHVQPRWRSDGGPRILGRPPMARSDAELAFLVGSLDGAGLAAARPAAILAPWLELELSVALTTGRSAERSAMGAGGLNLNLGLGPVVPFLCFGGGARVWPHGEQTGAHGIAYAGGGLRLGLYAGIALRVDGRIHMDLSNSELMPELSGGLAIFP